MRALLLISALVTVFIAAGVTSGMWIQLSLLMTTLGIFLATVTLRKSKSPTPHGGRGARVITLKTNLANYGIDSVEDLDEVA